MKLNMTKSEIPACTTSVCTYLHKCIPIPNVFHDAAVTIMAFTLHIFNRTGWFGGTSNDQPPKAAKCSSSSHFCLLHQLPVRCHFIGVHPMTVSDTRAAIIPSDGNSNIFCLPYLVHAWHIFCWYIIQVPLPNEIKLPKPTYAERNIKLKTQFINQSMLYLPLV